MSHVDWESCPRCESKKVVIRGKFYFFFIILAVIAALNFLALLFIPLFFLSIPLLFLSPLAFFLPKIKQCLDCKNTWRFNKNTNKQSVEQL
ncbi:hypothetical protein [Priestia aryabhattai]|uniref:hypothetical protein n=1 Tax=Priestia aryabhattai TaxID=412384 RepID=UPI003C87B3A0